MSAAAVPPVDLSRLPAPKLVDQLPFETIIAQMADNLRGRGDFDALVDSDPAMKVLQVAAYREMLLRADINDRARQLLLAFATDANLDHLGALLGVPRLEITPANPDTGARAIMESDTAFRQRIALAPEGLSVAGPELAYIAAARRADGDVAHASVISPAPGEVVVAVLSATGDGTASPALLAKVEVIVNARDMRPLTDFVTVQSAEIVPFSIAATIFTDSGPDASLVIATGQARLAAYLADSRSIGRDITASGIHAALHVAGVQRVELASWNDIVVGPTQAAHCTDILIVHGGYAN